MSSTEDSQHWSRKRRSLLLKAVTPLRYCRNTSLTTKKKARSWSGSVSYTPPKQLPAFADIHWPCGRPANSCSPVELDATWWDSRSGGVHPGCSRNIEVVTRTVAGILDISGCTTTDIFRRNHSVISFVATDISAFAPTSAGKEKENRSQRTALCRVGDYLRYCANRDALFDARNHHHRGCGFDANSFLRRRPLPLLVSRTLSNYGRNPPWRFAPA